MKVVVHSDLATSTFAKSSFVTSIIPTVPLSVACGPTLKALAHDPNTRQNNQACENQNNVLRMCVEAADCRNCGTGTRGNCNSRSLHRGRLCGALASKFFANVLVLFMCIEAWAGLSGELTMPVDRGSWELFLEICEEVFEGLFLLHGPRVAGVAVWSDAANVTYTDGVLVVALGVCAGGLDWPSLMHGAVTINDIMVADVRPSALEVPLTNFINSDVASFRGRGAMNDKLRNLSHDARTCFACLINVETS